MISSIRRKSWLGSGKKPLPEKNKNNNNTTTSNGCHQASLMNGDDLSSQNGVIPAEQRRRHSSDQILTRTTLRDLAEMLMVVPDAADDGRLCSEHPERVADLIKKHVTQHFPKPPGNVHLELGEHLDTVTDTVLENLTRLGPPLKHHGLIECYHRHVFDHLEDLLENVGSTKNSLVLMKWVMKTYLSNDLLTHPQLPQDLDPVKKVDLLLFTEWVGKAKVKLLKLTEKYVRDGLAKILQNEDAHDELYVDTVQFIDAIPKEAQKISLKLSSDLQEVCFKELQTFLTSYTAKQTEILRKISATDEMKPIFKILNNCHHIRRFVQAEAEVVENARLKEIMKETVTTLDELEAFTVERLKEIITDLTKKHLKKYFKSDNREFESLVNEVSRHFSELSSYQHVQTRVMDDAYRLVTHIYLKLLIQSDRRKLGRFWFGGVEETVVTDAEFLHSRITELAPGVRQWNKMLLEVKGLLECQDLEAMKVTVASMQRKYSDWSEDLQLLRPLLQWKGLSKREVKEVLGVMTSDLPGHRPPPRAASLISCVGR